MEAGSCPLSVTFDKQVTLHGRYRIGAPLQAQTVNAFIFCGESLLEYMFHHLGSDPLPFILDSNVMNIPAVQKISFNLNLYISTFICGLFY